MGGVRNLGTEKSTENTEIGRKTKCFETGMEQNCLPSMLDHSKTKVSPYMNHVLWSLKRGFIKHPVFWGENTADYTTVTLLTVAYTPTSVPRISSSGQ